MCFGINGSIICIATLFLADSVDLAEYLGLFCWVSWLCFHDGWENWKITRGCTTGLSGLRSGLRSSLRSSLRPPLRPSGPAVHRRVIFQIYHPSWKQSQDTQQKSPRYSGKSTLLSQKQRRYAYDIAVYAKSNWMMFNVSVCIGISGFTVQLTEFF